uniref:Protein BREAST CANCER SUSCEPTIBILITY 1-like protein n=1 Tax=Aegilops tauschii TaxID=37682 RepID=N1R5G7_AEGTA
MAFDFSVAHKYRRVVSSLHDLSNVPYDIGGVAALCSLGCTTPFNCVIGTMSWLGLGWPMSFDYIGERASSGVNASNTGQQLPSCRKGKGPGKHAKLKGNDGATGLGRVQTPVGVFEDECIFCHSFRTSEPCHGPMVLYHDRRIMPNDKGNPTNAVYVHEKCIVWAPRVQSSGSTFKNVENEINRASRWECSRCNLRGAALGCYYGHCRKTYHVACAMMIPECRWDVEGLHVWCPNHAPHDDMSSPTMESDIVLQVVQLNTSSSSLSQGYTLVEDSLKEFASLTNSTLVEDWDKNVTHVIVGRNTDTACVRSYAVLMAILYGKWIVRAGWIVDFLVQRIPHPETPYEMTFYGGLHTSISGPTKGRARAAEGDRTIFIGVDARQRGQRGAQPLAPKLFSGLNFCFSAYLHVEDLEDFQNLIAAGGGQPMEGVSPDSLPEIRNRFPGKVYFIYHGGPPRDSTRYFNCILKKQIEECVEYGKSGAQVISHLMLYDAILSYDARILEPGRSFHEYM